MFPLGQPNFISNDKPTVNQEEIIDDWDVLECPEEARKKGKLERSIEKFCKAKNAWDEFCERSHLIIQSVTILVDELKVDLTIGFTAHIQLQHYAALDKAFSNCGLDFDSEEESQQTQPMPNVKDDPQKVATMFETFQVVQDQSEADQKSTDIEAIQEVRLDLISLDLNGIEHQ